MNLPKVSIIIPVYNVEPYLEECINSVISQDYNNLEVIAVNDGSTDRSLQILTRFTETFPKLIIITISNQGLSIARNTGIEAASGDYIMFLDSDDWIEPNTVSLCMQQMRLHQIDAVFFNAEPFYDGFHRQGLNEYFHRKGDLCGKIFDSRDFFVRSIELNNYIVTAWSYLFKKDILGNLRFYPGIKHEDNLFTTLLLIEKQSSLICIGDKLYNYRVRPNAITTEKKQESHINGYLTVAKVLSNNPQLDIKNKTGMALNKFIVYLLLSTLALCRAVYNNALPYSTGKRAIQVALKINSINDRYRLVFRIYKRMISGYFRKKMTSYI